MNSQMKPLCVRIPAGRDNNFKVLNFNEGSFTKVQAGCKEPPCDGEAQGLHRLEALILLCLNRGGDGGVTRPEELGPPRKGAEKRRPQPIKAGLSSPGAFDGQTRMETESQEAQDAIQRRQASPSWHRIENGLAKGEKQCTVLRPNPKTHC